MEQQTNQEIIKHSIEQDLYAVRLMLTGEHSQETIRGYIRDQEIGHLAEGLKFQQRKTRVLEFDGQHTLGLGHQPMVDVNKSGYRDAKKMMMKGDKTAEWLMYRRQHDIDISEAGDELMKEGEVGDAFFVVTPYQEEASDEEAEHMGMWPQYRRSYLWVFRKISENELECTDVSIDQSSIEAYKKVFASIGLHIHDDVQSHDMPQYLVPLHMASNEDKDNFIDEFLVAYKKANDGLGVGDNAFEATAFIESEGRENLDLIENLNIAIAASLDSGKLHPIIRQATTVMLRSFAYLKPREKVELQQLLSADLIDERHAITMGKIIRQQRYGFWISMSEAAEQPFGNLKNNQGKLPKAPIAVQYGQPFYMDPVTQANIINQNTTNANHGIAAGKTQPGCSGGIGYEKQAIENEGASLLEMDPDKVKRSIFSKETEYKFDKKMFCVVCQSPPKKGETEKWCGPCGICSGCDKVIRAKEAAKAA